MASLIYARAVDNTYLPAAFVPPSSYNNQDVGNVNRKPPVVITDYFSTEKYNKEILQPPVFALSQSPTQDNKTPLEFRNLVHNEACAGCNIVYMKLFK